MNEITLGVIETHFAEMVWENEPLSSKRLVELCEQTFNWKRTTTYTVLKKLCDKGLFKNEKGLVSKVISKEEFYSLKSEKFVEDSFSGSLPAFLAAFTSRKKLTKNEIEEIKCMINKFEEG